MAMTNLELIRYAWIKSGVITPPTLPDVEEEKEEVIPPFTEEEQPGEEETENKNTATDINLSDLFRLDWR